MRKFLIALAATIALTSIAAAQTYGGEPGGWYSIDGGGTITNCRTCLQQNIQGDIMRRHYEAERAAHQRALYDQYIERRLEALEGQTQHYHLRWSEPITEPTTEGYHLQILRTVPVR